MKQALNFILITADNLVLIESITIHHHKGMKKEDSAGLCVCVCMRSYVCVGARVRACVIFWGMFFFFFVISSEIKGNNKMNVDDIRYTDGN